MFIFTYHLKGILQNQFNKILVKRLVGWLEYNLHEKCILFFVHINKRSYTKQKSIKNGYKFKCAHMYVITIIYIIIA